MTEVTKFGLTSIEAVRVQRQRQLATFYKRQRAFNRAKDHDALIA
jgi:hypothetical protein